MRKFGKLLVWILIAVVIPGIALAEGDGVGLGAGLGAGLAVGLAGLGCGIGQGLTASNTTAGIARNPSAAGAMFLNFILGMVFIESIAIYGLVIAFMLIGQSPRRLFLGVLASDSGRQAIVLHLRTRTRKRVRVFAFAKPVR